MLSTLLGGGYLSTHKWFGGLDLINPSVDKLVSSFTADLTGAVDRFFPMKSMKFHHSDKPWITPSIKMLVKERQKAFHSQNTPLWKSLRNKVQQTIAERKRSFYQTKVQDLKKDNCRKWWGTVNKMSGTFVDLRSPDTSY